jgi:hypothetical protein
MIAPRGRDELVVCHECWRPLGTIRRGPLPSRVVEALPGVRLYVDFAQETASLLCPFCHRYGRIFHLDRLRGVVLAPEESPAARYGT